MLQDVRQLLANPVVGVGGGGGGGTSLTVGGEEPVGAVLMALNKKGPGGGGGPWYGAEVGLLYTVVLVCDVDVDRTL